MFLLPCTMGFPGLRGKQEGQTPICTAPHSSFDDTRCSAKQEADPELGVTGMSNHLTIY